jgi:putative FmdB family regulatory protein
VLIARPIAEDYVPTYQYVCTDCASDLEAVQSFSEPSLTECPTCGGKLRKKFGAVGVVFKGSGFYRNDSREGRASAAAGAKSESGEKSEKPAASSDSGTKAETKSEPAAKSTSSDSGSSPSSSSGSSSGSGSSNGSSGSSSSGSSGTKTSSAA